FIFPNGNFIFPPTKNNDKNSNFDKDFKNFVARTYQQNSQNNDIKFNIAS
ncbi:TPA: hypothetical protein R4660_001958, partial [Campylobacter jejuni]|nr:hypothetical protein [Campylobacter jejuni]